MDLQHPLILLSSLSLALVAFLAYRASSRRFLVPPGPKPKYWSGNLHQLPTNNPWLTYAKWSESYGPLVYFRLYSRKVLVLNSLQAAISLLDHRSSTYSDRPMAWMYKELAGRKLAVFNISMSHPRFKKYTGEFYRVSYRAIQEEEMRTLLRGLVASPDQFISHIRRNAGAVILKVAYGWTVAENNDYFVSLMEESFKLHALAVKPGRWLVDTYPILRFIPAWFPFADFQREAARFRKELSRTDTIPHLWAKEQIESGRYVESFTSLHLPEEEDIIKWCSSALYAGGADTVVGVITVFILLMTLYPEVQKLAQAEIGRVTEGNRLPTGDDESDLPYVLALIKEVLRWAPVAPLGLPHTVTEDDVYEGYLIPKGTTVYANIWAIAHDTATYHEPSVFNPDRFLPPEGTEPRSIPGSAHFAEKSIFLVISSILAVFDINKAVDDAGQEIEPPVEFTSAVTSHVKPFPCRITVRAPELLAMIGGDGRSAP